MKRIVILISAIFLISRANAQKTYFGVKGGLNASSLHFDNNNSSDSKIGFNIGGLAHIHASNLWAIQPEVIYSLEGAKLTPAGFYTRGSINLNYINVPILVQRFFHNGFRLEGGPQIGFLINAKSKSGGVTLDNNSFKSTAFSIPLGVGYLTSTGIGLDARYVFGLSDINANENGSTVQSNVFQFGIFYQFGDTKMHKH